MRPVCTAAEVREADRRTIEVVGVPGAALMETAGRGLAGVVRDRFGDAARGGVAVVCGSGNNGGDGYVAARWLRAWGFPVHTWSLAGRGRGEAGIFRDACYAAGVPEREGIGDVGVIVDAVFGTGLTRAVTGAAAAALVRMDAHPALIVAADLPSGLSADDGSTSGPSVEAACTVTFGWWKRGLFVGEGPDRAGALVRVDLGFGDAEGVGAALADPHALAALWPRRAPGDHKNRSGHLCVIAGSTAMAGAAVLACRGALAAGAGLVTLAAPRGALPRLGGLPPEVMVWVAGERDHFEPPSGLALEAFSAVLAGPGLGGGSPLPESLRLWLGGVWDRLERPVVFDADALVAIGGAPRGPRVITPHPGEAARVLRCGVDRVVADPFSAVARLAGCCGGPEPVAVLKGATTLVSADPAPVSVHPIRCPVLGSGGSGDVLAGVTAGLAARGVRAGDAARLGVWAHGLAARRLAAVRAEGWTASDVAAGIAAAVEGFPEHGDRGMIELFDI